MQRLTTRSQFQAVLAGRVVAKTAHFALHVLPLSDAPSALFAPADAWIGALVPKRWAKRAATRNAIRRQVYQIGPRMAPLLGVSACVVRLRAAFDRALFPSASSVLLKKAVRSELEQLFVRLGPTGAGRAA